MMTYELCKEYHNERNNNMNNWIDVTERLPDGKGKYLCVYRFNMGGYQERRIDIMNYDPNNTRSQMYGYGPIFILQSKSTETCGIKYGTYLVTHWMPLPLLPK